MMPVVSVIAADAGTGRPRSVEAIGSQVREVGGELLLPARADSLVPELWREGLDAARAPLVVFTTTAMTPRDGWLAGLVRSMDDPSRSLVGGAIVPGVDLGPLDTAIYLARYANYGRLRPGTPPAGENSIYRRTRIQEMSDAWRNGFWEAEINRRLDPSEIGLEANAVLEYSGGASWKSTLSNRFRHGRQYGAMRGTSRLRALAAPIAAAVLTLRVWRVMRRDRPAVRLDTRGKAAWLALTTVWSIGEGLGAATRSA